MTQPEAVPTDGNVKWVFMETVANPAAATVAEFTAGLDISCYLTGDGWQPGTDEAVVTDERACSRQTYEQPGRFTDSLSVRYVHNPKSPADNEMFLALPQGATGFVGARWGQAFEDDIAAADIVDVYPVKAGVPVKQFNGANSMQTIMQRLFVTGPVQRDVLVAA